MKTKIKTNKAPILLALGALSVIGLPMIAAPASAQDAVAADSGKPISLNLINVPIQTALRTLFSSAGIRSYNIDNGVQGYANINVSDVPFSVALNQLLNAGNPPLTFTVENGVYNIKVKQAAVTPAVSVAANANTPDATTEANQPKRYYTIPVDSYDAYYIALLVGQTGVVEVVPNYPAGGGGQNGQNGQQGGNRGGIGGGASGFGGSGGGLGISTVGGGGIGGFGGGSSFGGGGGIGGGGFGGGGFGR